MRKFILTLILASLVLGLFAQSPTVTTNSGTYNVSSLAEGQFYYNGTTSIQLAGKWNNAAFEQFRAAIKIQGNISFENNYLLDVDMSSITLDASAPISNTAGLFKSCRHLRTVKLPTADLGNVEVSMKEIFYDCDSLRSAMDFKAFSAISDLHDAFTSCSFLPSVKFAARNNSTTAVDFSAAFFDCFLLDSIDISGFNRISNMTLAFCNIKNLVAVKMPVSNLATDAVSFAHTFSQCNKLKEYDISGFTNISSMNCISNYNYALEKVILPSSNAKTTAVSFYMAYGQCTLLDSIDLSGFTNVSNMELAFEKCTHIAYIKMPATNSCNSSVSFAQAFTSCGKLKQMDISMFSNISNMYKSFNSCPVIQNIKLPIKNINTEPVNFTYAFSGCTALDSIDISAFKAINGFVETFMLCDRLTSVRFGTIPTGMLHPFGEETTTPSQFNTLTNRNCLKYLPAGSVAPAEWENVVIGDRASLITIYDKYAYYSQTKYGPFYCPTAFTADSIQYTRTLSSGVYEGITIPFDATTNDGCVFSYSRNSNDTVYYNNVTQLDANTPYLIQGSGTIRFGGRNKLVPVSQFILPTILSEYVAVGNYSSQSNSTNLVMESSGKKFVRSNATVLPFRTYFIGNNGFDVLKISAPNSCGKCIPLTASKTIKGCPTALYKGVHFSTDTTFNDTIVNAYQCDSIVTIKIVITPPTKTVNVSGCIKTIYKGKTYTANTTLTEYIPSTVTCDTIQTTNIFVNPYITRYYKHSFCDSLEFSGLQIYNDTIIRDTLSTCRIYVDTIKIIKPYRTLTIKNCGPVNYNGVTYLQNTVFEIRSASVIPNGCDSVVTVNIIVDDCITKINYKQTETINIYPNPTQEGFYIDTSIPSCMILYTLDGKEVLSKEIAEKTYFNIKYLAKGVYIIKLTNVNGIIQQKLIKE